MIVRKQTGCAYNAACVIKKVLVIAYAILERLLMHLAHNTFRTITPFSYTETFCRFGLNLRLVARNEKLRLCPKVVVFPQCSHFAIGLSFQYEISTL